MEHDDNLPVNEMAAGAAAEGIGASMVQPATDRGVARAGAVVHGSAGQPSVVQPSVAQASVVPPSVAQSAAERNSEEAVEAGVVSSEGKGKRSPNNVRRLRIERMMSKAELARRANLSVLTIDRVEKGYGCRMDSKRKILEALGLSLADRVRVFGEEE